MNKDNIIKTAYTYWDETDAAYLTHSPLAETIIGDGATPGQSMASFIASVELNYAQYQQGKHRLYNRVGRPAKGRISIHLQVNSSTQAKIKELAQTIGITQGEALDYLVQKGLRVV